MKPRWDILGLGAVAVDDLIYVDHYPAPDSKIRAQARKRQGGGLTGTALVTAARLGARPAYYGILGRNELSRYTLKELEQEGVDCSAVEYQETAEPFHSTIVVVQPTAQRTVFSFAKGVVPVRAENITAALITRSQLLLVDHTVVEAALAAVEIARRHQIPVVADIEAERHPGVYDLMAQIDHLILGIKFARHVTGQNAPEKVVRALARANRACTAVTVGEHGCWYAQGSGEVRHVPAFPIQAVDTTGCGDVFHGAYAAGLVKGQTIDRCIQIASAAAALKATHPGGRGGIPTWETVEQLIGSA